MNTNSRDRSSQPVGAETSPAVEVASEKLTEWFNGHEFDSVEEMQGAWKAVEALKGIGK